MVGVLERVGAFHVYAAVVSVGVVVPDVTDSDCDLGDRVGRDSSLSFSDVG